MAVIPASTISCFLEEGDLDQATEEEHGDKDEALDSLAPVELDIGEESASLGVEDGDKEVVRDDVVELLPQSSPTPAVEQTSSSLAPAVDRMPTAVASISVCVLVPPPSRIGMPFGLRFSQNNVIALRGSIQPVHLRYRPIWFA